MSEQWQEIEHEFHGDLTGACKRIAALEAEVERLRALVETAHFEGYRQCVLPITHREAWRRSQTRRDLEGDAYTWELEGDA